MGLEQRIRQIVLLGSFSLIASCATTGQMYNPAKDPEHPIRKIDPKHFANVPDEILDKANDFTYTDSCGIKKRIIKYKGRYYEGVVDYKGNRCR